MKTASPALNLEGDSATRVGLLDPPECIDAPETTAIAERQETAVSVASDPMGMLQSLIDSGANPETLGKMMDLAERWQAGEAKRKWTESIAAFKAEIDPIIKKNPVRGKRVGDGPGPIHYHFASYDDIKAQTLAKERKHGIVTGYTFDFRDGLLHGTLKVTAGNHTEPFTFSAPIPKGVNTNTTQEYGMALSYLKRYLYCAAFDIVTCGEDTDAAGLRAPIYENAEQDGEAPHADPRDRRDSNQAKPAVNIEDLKAMLSLWLDKNPDIATNDEYSAWVKRVTGREFDVFKVGPWRPTDVEKCREALGWMA